VRGGHGPDCRLYDPSAAHQAAVISHWRDCILPVQMLARLPLELRFEVPVETARLAGRIGWLAALAAGEDALAGDAFAERVLDRSGRVLAGRIGLP
jgi:hypothetical protein